MFATRRSKQVAVLCLVATSVVGILLGGVAYLLGCDPDFYTAARARATTAAGDSPQRFLRESTQLFNAIENGADWAATFRADEINAWLFHDLPRKHTAALPAGVSDPQVAFAPDRVQIGARTRIGPVLSIVSLTGRVWVPEPNCIALKIERARAGALRLPMAWLVARLSSAGQGAGVAIEWKQHQGSPVALIRLGRPGSGPQAELTLAESADGTFRVAGRSRRRHGVDHVALEVDSPTPDQTNDQSPDAAQLK